jgi:hypothetical protein
MNGTIQSPVARMRSVVKAKAASSPKKRAFGQAKKAAHAGENRQDENVDDGSPASKYKEHEQAIDKRGVFGRL